MRDQLPKQPSPVVESRAFGSARSESTVALQLLTVDEVAALLRKSRKATYAMIERGQLPGVVRIGRSVRVRQGDLVEWLSGRAPSPRGRR